jgi:hypothetical protein
MSTYDKIPVKRIVYGIVLNDLPQSALIDDILLSGWILSKATPIETSACSEQLRKYGSLDFLGQPRQEMPIAPSGNGFSLKSMTDTSQWRYSVVRPASEPELNGAQLAEALRLSDANLCVELWCAKKLPQSDGPEQTIGGSPAQCVQYLGRAPTNECLSNFDVSHVSDIVSLRAKFDDATYPTIINAIQMFRDLDVNPPSPVKMLGYFGVVECLLSHAPLPSDSADSITRQLKRNLILLNNRMNSDRTLGFDEFGDTKPDKVISKLYNYRSAIAHGGDIQNKIKNLTDIHKGGANLTPALWPEWFLRRMVKRVLVQALREPQLVIDLKG